jgi:hypothetical protein
MADDRRIEWARKKVFLERGYRRQLAELAASSRIAAALIVSGENHDLLPQWELAETESGEKRLRHLAYIAATIAGHLWDFSECTWDGDELEDVTVSEIDVEVLLGSHLL